MSGSMKDPEALRVVGDPNLTADAIVYEVREADDLNPEWPVRYRLDLTGGGAPVLSQDQPGPFMGGDSYSDLFISLEALARLGRLAEALLNNG